MVARCLLLLFLSSALFAREISQNDDFQFWFYDSIQTPLCEKTSLIVESEVRYGNEATELYYSYVQGRLLYALNSHIEVAPGYRQIYTRLIPSDVWRLSYSPLFDYTLRGQWHGLKISDRNRFQYVMFTHEPNYALYRNRLLLEAPKELSIGCMRPVAFDEVFFREWQGFAENRLGIGAVLDFSEYGNTYLYYMVRHQIVDNEWRRHHVLWIWVNAKF